MILCLCYVLCLTLPSILLDILQIRHITQYASKPATLLSQKDYAISAQYSLANLRLSILSHMYDALLCIAWVYGGLALWQHVFMEESSLGFLCFVLGFVLINSVLQLPFSAYKQLYLDKSYGFSHVTWGVFLRDACKQFALVLVCGFVLLWLLLNIMDYPYWWVWGFGIVWFFCLLAQALYPTCIAPLFNTFTPLNDKPLQAKIQHLLQKVGLQAKSILIMDASRRDGRLNAYFGGLGVAKRVVLFDTLLEKVSQDGLLTILAHELGHVKHRDIIWHLLLQGAVLLLLFFIAGNLSSDMLVSVGLTHNHATSLVLLLLIAPVVWFWILPVLGFFSRKAEYRADAYSASLTSAHCLKEALIRIVNENKIFPHAHKAYVFFYYSHPPLLHRLHALEKLTHASP